MKKHSLFVAVFAIAGLVMGGINQAVAAPEQGQLEQVKQSLLKAFNGEPDSLVAAPIAGFYEASYGPKIYYISADGRHLISGEIYDLVNLENLTEQRRAAGRLNLMASIPEASLISYMAKNEKHVVTVFTDIDCVYCRKLHKDMAQFNALGITVRYAAFPRSGLDTPSYHKAVSVWCAKDRNKAMDNAKGQGKIEDLKCDAPVAQHMAVGKQLGVTGTPAIILQDGTLMPGYLPPPRLLQALQGQ